MSTAWFIAPENVHHPPGVLARAVVNYNILLSPLRRLSRAEAKSIDKIVISGH